jgi:hypothetical protein
VPRESILDVGGASDVMPIRIAFASQDVDESRPDASHDKSDGILRANALWLEWSRSALAEVGKYADAATLKGARVRRN